MLTNITPSPWRAAPEAEEVQIPGGSYFVYQIFSISEAEFVPANAIAANLEQAEANARLIAAAPDLLVFAEMVMTGNIDYNDMENLAEALVRKAREGSCT